MNAAIATVISYLPLVLALIMASGTADWSGMWQYYLFVPAVPIIAALDL